VASCWLYFRDVLAMHGHMNVKYVIFTLLLSHGNNGYANAPPCYFIVQCLSCYKYMLQEKTSITAEIHHSVSHSERT